MVEVSHLFQLMKMKGKIEKLIINIILICDNDNYCEQIFFTQIDNYYEPNGVFRSKAPK